MQPADALGQGPQRRATMQEERLQSTERAEGLRKLGKELVATQEEALCTFVQLAQLHLSAEQLASLFLSQAAGVFFHAEPMSFYGGTAIAYAATHPKPR